MQVLDGNYAHFEEEQKNTVVEEQTKRNFKEANRHALKKLIKTDL